MPALDIVELMPEVVGPVVLASRQNQLDVSSGSRCERFDVIGIGGDDDVAIRSEKHKCGVNDVVAMREGQELSGRAAERFVERTDLDTSQGTGEQRVTRSTAAPHLSNDAAVRPRRVPGEVSRLQASPHGPVVALQRDQRAAVEHERHRSA